MLPSVQVTVASDFTKASEEIVDCDLYGQRDQRRRAVRGAVSAILEETLN